MKFEIEINEQLAHILTTSQIGQDLAGMLKNPSVLLAQPGDGSYVIHRVVPAPADFDELLDR